MFLRGVLMNRILVVSLLLALGLPLASTAQVAPSATAAASAEYRVDGFRSARFGMRLPEVKAAIARDFEVAPSSVKELDHPAERTKLLLVELPALEPGPGAATVSYLFGASSQRLVHVNVAWTSAANAGEAERNQYTGAGLQLAKYFQALPWKENATMGNRPQGANGLLLFVGVDAKRSAVELHLTGIAIVGAAGPGPEALGPTQLRIAYIANVEQPDVATVKAGAF
jgi:hypothetical protein